VALLIGIITPPKGLGNVGKTEKLINKSDKVISDANKAGKLDEALSDANKLDKEYFENQYGKNNVEQGFGDYKETKDNINNNHVANQQVNKNSNFDEHVVNEKGLGNAGKGTINQQYLEEMSKNGVKFSPENILKVEKLADGKIVFLETGNSSAGLQHIVERHACDFAKIGVSESQIPNVVIDTVSKGKIIGYQGKGTGRPIYEITINEQK